MAQDANTPLFEAPYRNAQTETITLGDFDITLTLKNVPLPGFQHNKEIVYVKVLDHRKDQHTTCGKGLFLNDRMTRILECPGITIELTAGFETDALGNNYTTGDGTLDYRYALKVTRNLCDARGNECEDTQTVFLARPRIDAEDYSHPRKKKNKRDDLGYIE